jgi:hypothetical protein
MYSHSFFLRVANSYAGESFNDVRLRFRVITDDAHVSIGWFIDDVEIHPGEITSIAAIKTVPSGFLLYPNYPNPFNPETTIRYALPRSGRVTLNVYNVTSQKVETLVDTSQPAGDYSVGWAGRDDAGKSVASGVYVCRLSAGGIAIAEKMVLVE